MSSTVFEKGHRVCRAVAVLISILLAFSMLGFGPGSVLEAHAEDASAPASAFSTEERLSPQSECDSASADIIISDDADGNVVIEDEASDREDSSSGMAVRDEVPSNGVNFESNAVAEAPSSVFASDKGSPVAFAKADSNSPALGIRLLDALGDEISDASIIHIGDTISVEALASGVSGPKFNYVWVRNGDWSDGSWDSTVNGGKPATDETSWNFTPTVAGEYDLYVDLKDASGNTMVTKDASVKVVEDWKVSSINIPSAGKILHMGDPIQVDVSVTGADAGAARFNFVWVRNGDWSKDSWDSTINAAGVPTHETSWAFEPGKSGNYTLFIDAYRTDGTKTTSKGYEVKVVEDWQFDGFNVSSRTVILGDAVSIETKASGGDVSYARFNYVWNYSGDWSEWSSVELETGCLTYDRVWSFTPQKAGTYQLYVDAVRTDGSRETKSTTIIVESNWAAEGITLSSNGESLQGGKVKLGDPLEVSLDMEEGSNLNGLTYNFVWQRGSSWEKDDWDSLANHGLTDTTGLHVYQLGRIGKYTVYVDIIGTDGKKVTLSTKVEVVAPYTATGVLLSTISDGSEGVGEELQDNAISVGDSVLVSPKMTGDIEEATFNFVWSHEGSWDVGEWDSTVNRTNKATTDSSWMFTPDKYGTYDIFVDVIAADGSKQTFSTKLTVDSGWVPESVSIDKNSPQLTGTELIITPGISGESAQYVRFNYVWMRDGWAEWSSNLKETDSYTDETSFTFTPTHSGNYEFSVDYYDTRTGQVITKTVSFRINKAWDLQRLDLSYTSPLRPWSAVEFTPVITGDKSQLKYNYVWERDGWAEWNSSLRASGGVYHPYDTGTWVIGGSGTYNFYIDVVDQFGETETAQVTGIKAYSASDIIATIERNLSSGFDGSGWKYENALLRAGGSLCNGRHGWWCANYIWWGFYTAGFSELWGVNHLQVDPEYLANEFRSLGRYWGGTGGVQRGDILFSYWAPWRGGQSITHAAYVVSTTATTVTVVEGNMSDGRNRHTYSRWDSHLRGYARPAY